MGSNFAFLEKAFPVLAKFGRNVEAYLYSDSNSSLMKLGMIGETISSLMFTYDRIALPKENSAVERINAPCPRGNADPGLGGYFPCAAESPQPGGSRKVRR